MSSAESNAEAPVGTGLVMLCGAFFDSAAHAQLMAHFRSSKAITWRLAEHDMRQTASPARLAFANRICRDFHIDCIEIDCIEGVTRDAAGRQLPTSMEEPKLIRSRTLK